MKAFICRAMSPTNEFGTLLTTDNPEQFYRNYRYDVSPVDDNRPFFFYTVQPRDLLNFLAESDGERRL